MNEHERMRLAIASRLMAAEWESPHSIENAAQRGLLAADALLAAAGVKPDEARATLESFEPTSEAINALPEPLRKYIHDLETRCDPAGEVAELALTRSQNAQLQARIAELTAELAAARAEPASILEARLAGLIDDHQQVCEEADRLIAELAVTRKAAEWLVAHWHAWRKTDALSAVRGWILRGEYAGPSAAALVDAVIARQAAEHQQEKA